MTKLAKTITAKATGAFISAQLTAVSLKNRLKQTLTSNRGDVFGQHGIIFVICIALGGVALAFLIPYFKNDIGGGITDKTTEYFNMK